MISNQIDDVKPVPPKIFVAEAPKERLISFYAADWADLVSDDSFAHPPASK